MDDQGIELLGEAARQFRYYEQNHRDKLDHLENETLRAETVKKADVNAAIAAKIEAYLADHTQLLRMAPMPPAPAVADAVNPPHYRRGEVECIDGIKSALTPEEFRGFCRGTAMRYIWRQGQKDDPVQEAGKAGWYIRMGVGDDPRLDRKDAA